MRFPRILRTIARNLTRPPATVRLPERVPVPPGFRGRVLLDPDRCLACGMCAYVCVSDAITGVDEEGAYTWRYDPGRCAFCARCVERCPGGALSMDAETAPSYERRGELAVARRVAFPRCPDCGAPTRPATPELLARAFGQATDAERDAVRRCERCRRKRLQRRLILKEEER